MKNQKIITQDNEIDLMELSKIFWIKRYFILKITSTCIVIGLIIAFTSKVEYEASCKLMPESQEGMKGSLGGLGSLAGLAGIDLGMIGTSGSLSPELYPEIVKSISFQLDLINTPIRFENLDTLISSYSFFTELDSPSLFGVIMEYTIGLPGKLKKLFNSNERKLITASQDGLVHITKDDSDLLKQYQDRIHISIDDKTGIISVMAEMPDAYAAADVAGLVVKKLTEKVADYKLEKALSNLDFIKDRYLEVEKEYEAKQGALAHFTDRNKNITSSIVQAEYLRLQNEMNITFEVYKGLATQLEQAKIKVKEETPVFTVLEPVKVPVEKSKPKRLIILIGLSFLGFILSLSYILVKHLFQVRWKEAVNEFN